MASSPPPPPRPWSPSPSSATSHHAFPSRPATPTALPPQAPRSFPPSPGMQSGPLERSRAQQLLLSLLEREQSLSAVLQSEEPQPRRPRLRQRSFTFSEADRSASPTRPSTPISEPRSPYQHRPIHAAPGMNRSNGDSVRRGNGYHSHSAHGMKRRNSSGTSLQSTGSMDSMPELDIVSLVERSIALRNPRRSAPHFSTSPILRATEASPTSPNAAVDVPKIAVQTPSKRRSSTVASPTSPPFRRPPTPLKASPRPAATHHRSSPSIPKTLNRPILPHRAASEALARATSRSLESRGIARPSSRNSQLEPSPEFRTRRRSRLSPAASSPFSSPLSTGTASDGLSPPLFDLNDGGSVVTPWTCGARHITDTGAPAMCTCSVSRPSMAASDPGDAGADSPGSGFILRSPGADGSSATFSSPVSVGIPQGSVNAVKPVPIPKIVSTATTSTSSDGLGGGPVLMTKTSGSLQTAWSAERASRRLQLQEGRVCFDDVLSIPEDKRGSSRRWSLW